MLFQKCTSIKVLNFIINFVIPEVHTDTNPVAIIDSGEPDNLSDFMNIVTSVSTEDLIKDDCVHSVYPELSGRLQYKFFYPKTLFVFEKPMSL